jgi:DNA-3-methyladenine glycosylase
LQVQYNSQSAQKLPRDFFLDSDVVGIARSLLGKILVSKFDGRLTCGRICETEAYRAPDDRACHAWNNRRTPRTEVMFWEGGRAYIYLCYGLHHLFNVVTGPEGYAHAVLIRMLEPLEGQEYMAQRRGGNNEGLIGGPGVVGKALGFHTKYSGQDFYAPDTPLWIEADDFHLPEQCIQSGKRIGIDYAGASADWPWRFWYNPQQLA